MDEGRVRSDSENREPMSKPRPKDMTRDDLEMGIIVELSARHWHDITEDYNPDPEAVQCLALGYNGKSSGETIWMLTRYEDTEEKFALVCSKDGKAKRVVMEQFKFEWLWEQVTEK